MKKNASKDHHIIDLKGFLLSIFVTSITALFLISYCILFDDFGLFAKQRLLENPLITFFITPVLFWVSAYLCRAFSPKASGNHLQQAINQLKQEPDNFKKVENLLSIRLVMIKALSSLSSTLGGGALGKEGPSVHIASGIFATFADKYRNILPKICISTWVSAATGAGLAVAFNAPIAGIVFVAEKLSKARIQNTKTHMIWTLVIISIVTIIFYKPEPLFTFHNLSFRLGNESFSLIILAIFCGILAFLFQVTNNYFYEKFSKISSNWWHLVPIVAGILVCFINFFCGIYSFSGGIITAQDTLTSSSAFLSYEEVFGRILNTILTFISGCAGGLIAPAISIGAGLGSIASNFATNVDLGVFLLIGMTSFLAAILGEPIAAAFVIFETTGQNIENVPFLASAAIISHLVFRSSNKVGKMIKSVFSKIRKRS